MLRFNGTKKLHRIVILNPKGGSGKSTLAVNVAGYLATKGRKVALVDMDVQGSSTQWLRSRGSTLPYIHSIPAAYTQKTGNSEHVIEIPKEYDYVVVDAPASVPAKDLIEFTCGAHAILIPVLPSAFDIHAASRLISSLLLVARVSRTNGRLGIVANRVKKRTLSYRRLQRFLDSLSISVAGTLRDSQNYVQAAQSGLCIHEMQPSSVRVDSAEWEEITTWLETRLSKPLTARDWYRPTIDSIETPEIVPALQPQAPRRRVAFLSATAAALGTLGVSFALWQITRTAPTGDLPEPAAAFAGQDAGEAVGPRTIERSAAASVQAPAPEPEEALLNDDLPDQFRQKWQLSGVARSEGDSVLLLSQRDDRTTHRIRAGNDFDGWRVSDAGADYAIFTQNDNEVRLEVPDEQTH